MDLTDVTTPMSHRAGCSGAAMVQDGCMTLEITVRGSAEKHYAAERAIVVVAAAIEGLDKERVLRDAIALQEPLTKQLGELVVREAVSTWSSDQVRVYSQHPWGPDGERLPLTHYSNISVRAEFLDFERLSGFVDYWAGKDGVQIADVEWDVTVKNRRVYESDVRRAAVDDAVAKAQAYSDALRKGRVQAVQLADPGMLRHPAGGAPQIQMARTFDTGAGETALTITPGEIEIYVEVDAKFLAD